MLPDGDDPPPARPRMLTYDFSRWNNPAGLDDFEDDGDGGGDALAASLDRPSGSLSFKIYTPDEIKAQPIRRSPPPPPPPEEGIKDVREMLELAREIGPTHLLTRFGVGALAGGLMLIALVGFALLVDDTHEGRGVLAGRTETPSAAFMPITVQDLTQIPPVELEIIGDEDTSGTYFELPDQGARKPAPKVKAGAGARAKTSKASKPIVRENPY